MRLAIADPPYLGRANRWYGTGRGHGAGRGRPDSHPSAQDWDLLDTHLDLLARLEHDYDGWAYAGAPDSLPAIAHAIPAQAQVLVWHRGNAIPNGGRIRTTWEYVIARIPNGRTSRDSGLAVDDHLTAGIENRQRFVGAKPAAWTRWVLAVLGHTPGVDVVVDIFPGSGAITHTLDGLLDLGVSTTLTAHD